MKIHYPTRSARLVRLRQRTAHQYLTPIAGGGVKNRSATFQSLLAKALFTACTANHNNHFTFAHPNSCRQP